MSFKTFVSKAAKRASCGAIGAGMGLLEGGILSFERPLHAYDCERLPAGRREPIIDTLVYGLDSLVYQPVFLANASLIYPYQASKANSLQEAKDSFTLSQMGFFQSFAPPPAGIHERCERAENDAARLGCLSIR